MSEGIKRLRSYLAVREENSQRSLEIGNHIHGFGTVTGEAALYASDIQSLLNAIEALQAERDAAQSALATFIYETTHLSPEEDDGSHWCKISKECLEAGRRARSNREPG